MKSTNLAIFLLGTFYDIMGFLPPEKSTQQWASPRMFTPTWGVQPS